MRALPPLAIALTLAIAAPTMATDQSKTSAGQNANKAISSTGTLGFIGLGLLLPFVQDGGDGFMHSFRAADSTVLSVGLAYGLQQLTHEKRPNSNAHDSFPSIHASAAFAIATMQAQYHPWEAPLWYAGAAVIGVSRVQLREHHWGDVIAGAALGFGTARLELSSHRGLLIYPFVGDSGDMGLVLSAQF